MAWTVQSIGEMTIDDLAPVRDAAEPVGVLLIGCGEKMVLIPPQLRAEARAWGVVIEAMGTGAACRTYNVLLSEGRDVATALIPID